MADQKLPRSGPAALAILRVGVALMWIQNAGWKVPPDFGKDNGRGLYKFTRFAVDHEVFPPYAWFTEQVVLPNFTFFGWLTLILEASIGAFLLVGLFTRLFALAGLGQSVAITLSVLNAPHEWHWSYFLMILAHLTLLGTDAGRYYGLDGVLPRTALPMGRHRAAIVLGGGSVVSALFVFVDGDPWGLIEMTPVSAAAALVLGVLACAGGVTGVRWLVAGAGIVYAVGALSILIGLAADSSRLTLGSDGSASTFSWFLGMGAGLLALSMPRSKSG